VARFRIAGIIWTPPQGLLHYAKRAVAVFRLALLHMLGRCQMKVLVRKFADGSRRYLCVRTVGDTKVAHQFALQSGQKLSEADIQAARKNLDAQLQNRLRMLPGQVNPGQGG